MISVSCKFVQNKKEGVFMTEKTLRRKAKKIGYSIHKGFQHYMSEPKCPVVYGRPTGYMVTDDSTGEYMWGSYDCFYDYQLDLNIIEKCLRREYDKLGLKF